jgi:hypothetical protein
MRGKSIGCTLIILLNTGRRDLATAGSRTQNIILTKLFQRREGRMAYLDWCVADVYDKVCWFT